MNPYAQGGRKNHSTGQLPSAAGGRIPSIHEARPHIPIDIPAGPEKDCLPFSFDFHSPQTRSVLNSTVLTQRASKWVPLFFITTTSGGGEPVSDLITSIRDEWKRDVAAIEWKREPIVQLKTNNNEITRQYSYQFLPLSQSGTSRTMTIEEKTYQWTHDFERGRVYFHNVSCSPPEFLGFSSRKSTGPVKLSLLPTTIVQGLLDVVVLAATLLYSNCPIDRVFNFDTTT
ncbi:hypothetical protein DFP72DRAFT_810737 [Ephemerocybe angulata]|uniref:Uncharacterized protein n=1 Tax=Ephemerocybe angulata TaxID=980116 RepID=A0A8H6HZM1_9AGAR|nr:hypothetical protein DFP72DRAFT_810737 [Tulosesus angulatus]